MPLAPVDVNVAQAEQLEEGFPQQLNPLVANEEATPEEEKLVGAGEAEMMDYAYSENGLSKIVETLNSHPDELFQIIPQIVMPMLMKAKNTTDEITGGDTPSSIFFGEGALIEAATNIIFEIADQIDLPGVKDPDQYAGALIGVHKAIGERMLEMEDGDAILEAKELGQEMLLTGDDGEQLPPDHYSKKDPLATGVEQGLLSQQGAGGL